MSEATPSEEVTQTIGNAEANSILDEAGIHERYYNTYGAAWFFGKSEQWVYYNLRHGKFRWPGPKDELGKPQKDSEGNEILGDLIEPRTVGRGKKRQYTLPIIKAMAISAYERGIMKKGQLAECLVRIDQETSGDGSLPEKGRDG